ncbi:MAG: DUF429 domain-containing protein [Nanopusillaceae archaeon]
MYRIVGIDLAAKEKNKTGLCYKDTILKFKIVYTNEEILEIIKSIKPDIVVIDAPLSKEKIPFRDSDLELLRRGFRPMPLSIKSIFELANRGILIKNEIEKTMKSKVLETFPRAVEKILGFKYEKFKHYFKSKHLYDSWLCYLAGLYYSIGKSENINGIIIPKW